MRPGRAPARSRRPAGPRHRPGPRSPVRPGPAGGPPWSPRRGGPGRRQPGRPRSSTTPASDESAARMTVRGNTVAPSSPDPSTRWTMTMGAPTNGSGRMSTTMGSRAKASFKRTKSPGSKQPRREAVPLRHVRRAARANSAARLRGRLNLGQPTVVGHDEGGSWAHAVNQGPDLFHRPGIERAAAVPGGTHGRMEPIEIELVDPAVPPDLVLFRRERGRRTVPPRRSGDARATLVRAVRRRLRE